MDKKYQAHFQDQQESGSAVENQEKLSLKKRMIILSRKDRMGRAVPTFLRTLVFTVLLIAAMLVCNLVQVNAWNSSKAAAVPVENNEVQFSFVGDVMLGRNVENFGEKESFSELFRTAKTLWSGSSLVFANLENPVLKQNNSYTKVNSPTHQVNIGATRTALHAMAKAGINVVAAANNHMGDFGRKGVRHTIEALEKYDIEYAGAGANLEEAGSYRLLEADGVTVGFMSCTSLFPPKTMATKDGYGVCPTGYSNLYRNVAEAASYSDFLVVYVHFGEENALVLSETQKRIAHQLIESGADVVIGCHPHILQEIEQYKDGIIFYSMGNFIFDQAPRMTRNTALLQLNVDKTTGEGYFTLIPMRLNNFHPYVTTNAFYLSQIHHALLKNLPETSYTVSEDGRIHIPMKVFEPGQKMDPPETEPVDTTATDAPESND